MEGQNFYALSLEQCLLEPLEPHHFSAVCRAILGIIALNCAIIDVLSNLFGLLFVVMAGLARLAIANTHCAIILALLGHGVLSIHFCFLSALIEHSYLFVGTLYKTLDK